MTCILGLIRQAIELCNLAQDDDLRRHVLRLLSSGSTMELLRGLTQRLDVLRAEIIEPLLRPGNVSWLQILIDNLLDDNDCNGMFAAAATCVDADGRVDNAEADSHVQVGRLLDLADDFSIGLCKLKMQIILNEAPKPTNFPGSSGGGDDASTNANTIARAFIRGIASAAHDRRKICTDLVTVLNKDSAGKIRTDVEDLFLDWTTFLQTRQLFDQLDLPLSPSPETGESLARAFLSVIDATSASPAPSPAAAQHTATLLVDRLAKLLLVLHEDEDLPRNKDAFSEFRCWYTPPPPLTCIH